MNKLYRNHVFLSLLVIVLAFFFSEGGCGGGGSSSSGGSGTVSVGLTDAATGKYAAVYVTIDEVQVHPQDGPWQTVATPLETYNLLELVNGVIETLGRDTVPAGDYTQMRLIIGQQELSGSNLFDDPHKFANYIIRKGDPTHEQIELKVPSGPQTGIKLVSPFSVRANGTTELILDFDADRSVIKAGHANRSEVKAGRSGKWLLKPTIRVLATIDKATVRGQIDSTNDADMNGTMVSVQKHFGAAANETEELQVLGGTVAQGLEDSNNATYTLFTDQGQQNLVAYKDGFLPAVHTIDPASGQSLTRNFRLQNATTGVINGTVSVNDDLFEEEFVVLSFRHQLEYIGSSETAWIELKSLRQTDENTRDGNFSWPFEATLPDMSGLPGDYRVVATLFRDDIEDLEDPMILDEQGQNATLGDDLTFSLEK